MKVYLATSGDYSDYRVRHVFARREDAEAYALGDDVEEFEVQEGPIEVRPWHQLMWWPGRPDRQAAAFASANPLVYSTERRDYDGNPRHADHHWDDARACLEVEGWDRDRVKKVYSEQRAQYLARKEGIAP